MTRGFELSVKADLENLKKVRSFIGRAGKALGMNGDTTGDLCLVVDEAITNIITHGYDGADGAVDIEIHAEGDSVVITIRDQAPAFDAGTVGAPDLDESLSERQYGGMGVYLIRKLTDEAEFRIVPGKGNELRLVKRGVLNPDRP